MTDHRIQKPSLFISHAASDADFARAVQMEVERVFANGLAVFCTSSPGAIDAGSDWLAAIEKRLVEAQAVIALITPLSIERPWVWFELGATWQKGRDGRCKIYPLCAAEVSLSELPPPLDRLQALSLGKAEDLRSLFSSLIAQFGFGSLSAFRAGNITKRVPKYKTVKPVPADLAERAFYSGRYSGYSDEELIEVIGTGIFEPDQGMRYLLTDRREANVFHGKLLHYRDIDRRLELPPGTAKRLLKATAAEYEAFPEWEGDNCIRFGAHPGDQE